MFNEEGHHLLLRPLELMSYTLRLGLHEFREMFIERKRLHRRPTKRDSYFNYTSQTCKPFCVFHVFNFLFHIH